MQATQFVMAHGVEQDRLCAILPEGLPSCDRCFGSTGRSGGEKGFLEFRTAVERDGKRGLAAGSASAAFPTCRLK